MLTERQIAAAFPDFHSAERVREVARRSYDSLGRTSIETALLPTFSRETLMSMFERVEGWHLVRSRVGARAKASLSSLATSAIGKSRVRTLQRTGPFSAVSRRMANPVFDAYLTRTRAKGGMNMIWDGDAVRA